MLSLILVNEAVYDRVRQAAVEAQSPNPEKRPLLGAALAKLMDGVARSLEPKNRDKFTQNLTVVRHEIRAKAT
jgi:exportin-7